MNVKRIEVDKKDGCVACPFCVRVYNYMRDHYECRATSKKVFDCTGMKYKEYIARFEEIGTPDWCPLVVEEVCEYRIEIEIHKFSPPYHYLKYRTCSGEFEDLVYHNFGSSKFCPNCGRRIKYVESEE